MDTFMCHICGLNLQNPTKVKEHLKKAHNIQVEDEIRDTFKCPQCTFINNDMAEMRNHMVHGHAQQGQVELGAGNQSHFHLCRLWDWVYHKVDEVQGLICNPHWSSISCLTKSSWLKILRTKKSCWKPYHWNPLTLERRSLIKTLKKFWIPKVMKIIIASTQPYPEEWWERTSSLSMTQISTSATHVKGEQRPLVQ